MTIPRADKFTVALQTKFLFTTTPKDSMQSGNWLRITELAQAASQLRKAD